MNFKEELKDRVDHIEAILKEYLPKEEGWQKTVIAAMNYSVLAGGKRLRPMLMEETYRLFGGKGREIEPFMAAIEMIPIHWCMTIFLQWIMMSTAEAERQHMWYMAKQWLSLQGMAY